MGHNNIVRIEMHASTYARSAKITRRLALMSFWKGTGLINAIPPKRRLKCLDFRIYNGRVQFRAFSDVRATTAMRREDRKRRSNG